MKRENTFLKTMAFFACGLAILLSMVALQGCEKPKGSFKVDGCYAELESGVLTLSFEGNATTGYDWVASIPDSATGAVKLTQDEYVSETSTDAVGAGGRHVFALKGTGDASGSVTVEFKYTRSWESTSDDKTATVELGFDASGNINSVNYSCDGSTASIN